MPDEWNWRDWMYRISKRETGKRIRRLLKESGVTVREVQEEMGLESPQAIYKWLNGKSMPSTENLLILAKLLRIPMEEMIVTEEQDEYDIERKNEWEKNHPPVFMAHRFWGPKPVRRADEERLSLLIEDLAQERLRVASCAH